MGISPDIRRAIRKYEAINAEGFCFYPITVREYEEYLIAKSSIDAMQQSFPPKYISMPLLDAYYAMEYDAINDGRESTGLLYRCLLFLALALRLEQGEEAQERVKLFHLAVAPDNPRKLNALKFDMPDGTRGEITPVQFQKLRPILAAQNGIDLISETANPAIVEAERDINEANAPKLDMRIDTLLSTIAAMANVDEGDIEDWPILKLQNRQKAYQRVLSYMICGIGETQGTTWKGGNPHPNPFFDKISEDSAGVMPLQDFAGGQGLKAMQNAGG